MKRRNWSEVAVAALVSALAAALCNPLWMPMGAYYAAAVGLLVAVAAFAVFLWRERGGDERDALLRRVGGHAAMTAVAAVLVVGVSYQAVALREVDYWLAGALVALVLGKALGYRYASRRY